jgi:hypothetical protein
MIVTQTECRVMGAATSGLLEVAWAAICQAAAAADVDVAAPRVLQPYNMQMCAHQQIDQVRCIL